MNQRFEAELKHLATKEDLWVFKEDLWGFREDLAKLEVRLLTQIIQSERAQRGWLFGAYGLIFGTYALIVASVFINHFWR